MSITLQYGQSGLPLDFSGLNATVLEPRFVSGLPDEAAGFQEAVRKPMGGKPLRECVSAGETVAVVIADNTRPLPSERLLPWIFAELSQVPSEQITIIIGTGSHRGNTPEEIEAMVGPEVASRYRILNHDAHDPERLVRVGDSPMGYPVDFCREYVEADRRIAVGFIEPHFMAGFSGGYKAVFPGVTGIETIMEYHGVHNIGDVRSTWGEIEENPTQAHVRAGGSLLPIDFMVNVTLNRKREITAYFCGEVLEAHRAGCAWVKEKVMIPCDTVFPIVVTTNSGYPLDQNLYQAVKGMSAAAQIVAEGGLIMTAARCNDGFPEHGNFRQQLYAHDSAEALLETIYAPGFRQFDQWQTQKFAEILRLARVGLYSELPAQAVSRAHMQPVTDLREAIEAEIKRLGGEASTPIAVLPEGPLTVPYLTAGVVLSGD